MERRNDQLQVPYPDRAVLPAGRALRRVPQLLGVVMIKHPCDRCGELTVAPENDYGEFICMMCLENEAEAAYERHCEDFHDGGCTRFNSLQQQQIEARRLK